MGGLLPAMTQEKLDAQRDVVMNERRWTVDNQPYGTWWEKLPALAFPPTHPFHHSLIGSFEDLGAASLDDIVHFFRTFYTPDNAVLTIVGDFDTLETRALVELYFGPIARGNGKPQLASVDLPERFGDWRHERVEDDVMVPRLYLAFRSPAFGSAPYYAASVCGAVMGMRRGSRLHRTLVRERQVASEANVFTFDLSTGSDLLIAAVTARPGVEGERLEEELVAEVARMRHEGVTEREVSRAVALIETDFIATMQAAGERADRLSQFTTYFDDPRLVNEQTTRYRTVTARDVNEFAQGQLGEDNRISLLYVPRSRATA